MVGVLTKLLELSKKKIESLDVCKNSESLDLKFFSKTKQTKLFFKSDNNIFIVHSYGLNWFLKNDIPCRLLFNFFGAQILSIIKKSQI